MWDDHLGVCFRAKGARLKQGLLVPHTLLINVESCLDVVDGIDYEVEALPEFVIEDTLSRRVNVGGVGLNFEVWVENLCNTAGSLRLGRANIVLSEEELAIKVRNLDIIVVSAVDLALWSATDSHQCEGLDVLAAKCARSHHERIDITQLSLDISSQYFDLVIVSGVHGLSVNLALGKDLENLVVKPLLQGSVFTSVLDDFLGDDTAEERTLGH